VMGNGECRNLAFVRTRWVSLRVKAVIAAKC